MLNLVAVPLYREAFRYSKENIDAPSFGIFTQRLISGDKRALAKSHMIYLFPGLKARWNRPRHSAFYPPPQSLAFAESEVRLFTLTFDSASISSDLRYFRLHSRFGKEITISYGQEKNLKLEREVRRINSIVSKFTFVSSIRVSSDN